ncbi:hypothetical protein [Mycobacterium szulgai]|uniref:Mce protein n=1 Tax=Mycobacterium szulgai TaxID=1787 RepID=A0A1X2EDM3_MYCSZ|nr:hypothetical protein [Mycobacterium szulgai]MCV7076091.1 hypothetical protein [Mycobacterium szulgai]ORW98481.1 hypothetical protein AWC27_03590 [Mycobacterium szulgai]
MAETTEPPTESVSAEADALALAEEAEAEAAEAEALAAAARAKARAARLRRAALTGEVIDEDADEDDFGEYYDEYDEDYESEEAEEAEETAPGSWRDRLPSWLPLPGLAMVAKIAAILVICGFAGFSGYIVWKHHEANDRQQRAAAFAAGAKQGVINMTSLDFNKAKEDVQRVIDSSTGEFRDDFQARAADFTKVVEQSKVVTEGTVNATAVESMDEHSALVLVSATSRVTNSAGAKDEPRAWRLRVTVTEEAGQYKMSKVEFVP